MGVTDVADTANSAPATSNGHKWVRAGAISWFFALLIFALWSREPLRREGLWRDEALSVYIARADSYPELIRRNGVADYNPPLFNTMLAIWGRVVGFEEAPLKTFAAAWGLLACSACVFFAYTVGGRIAAAVAGALAVNSPLLIRMSGELRPYSLSAFLCLLSLALLLRVTLAQRRTGLGWSFLAIASFVFLVYSHVAGAIVAAGVLVFGLTVGMRRHHMERGRRLAILAIAALASFTLWAPTTLRQARVGLPYEHSIGAVDRVRSLLQRSVDVMPIPGGLYDPLAWLGLLLLTFSAFGARSRLLPVLRRQRLGLALAGLAGLSVWLTLGLFSVESRYLTIPAAVTATLAACLVGVLFDAARSVGGLSRILAGAGVACLILGSFNSRATFYADLRELGNRPKSGIRSLCRDRTSELPNLMVIAPDYLAATVWYYCGDQKDLRGFVRWRDAVLLDLKHYGELWTSPTAVADCLADLRETLAVRKASSFDLVFDDSSVEAPLLRGVRIRTLRAALSRIFEPQFRGHFVGRVESVSVVSFIGRVSGEH